MGQFITNTVNFSGLTSNQYPPVGSFIIGIDVIDDILKKMDSNGVLTSIGTNTTNRVLDYTNNGETLLSSDSILFCNSLYSFINVNMPDVALMQGKSMTFINVSGNYEGQFILNGPFNNASTYNINLAGDSVTFMSDGTTYWITATN